MSLSGPDVHQQLMNAYAETQARLEDERAAAMQLQFSREELSNDRGDALVNLAEFYLPELSRDAIETTWLEIRPTVSNILLGKEDHRRRLQETIDQVTADLEKDERQLLEINARLDESIERRVRPGQQGFR